jgi:hypothetical protein
LAKLYRQRWQAELGSGPQKLDSQEGGQSESRRSECGRLWVVFVGPLRGLHAVINFERRPVSQGLMGPAMRV